MGLIGHDGKITLQLYSEVIQKFRLAASTRGKGAPPERLRARVSHAMDPLPFWYQPIEESMVDKAKYPLHAITQRPMAMYHSWGSQNAWLRQILSENRLYVHRALAGGLDLADEDWVYVESRNGRVKCKIRLMDGVNPHTVWTWNAIGKRAGAWTLAENAPEADYGFLLNHVISEYLPDDGKGRRLSNSDPITGQAAWFDLTVRIEKCPADPEAVTLPRMPRLSSPFASERPAILRYGAPKPAFSEAT
jgi:anaerobic selenocysteine-containing dehydrogenase